jgi:hypothetical protein
MRFRRFSGDGRGTWEDMILSAAFVWPAGLESIDLRLLQYRNRYLTAPLG